MRKSCQTVGWKVALGLLSKPPQVITILVAQTIPSHGRIMALLSALPSWKHTKTSGKPTICRFVFLGNHGIFDIFLYVYPRLLQQTLANSNRIASNPMTPSSWFNGKMIDTLRLKRWAKCAPIITTSSRLISHHAAEGTSCVAGAEKNTEHITPLRSHHEHCFLQ